MQHVTVYLPDDIIDEPPTQLGLRARSQSVDDGVLVHGPPPAGARAAAAPADASAAMAAAAAAAAPVAAPAALTPLRRYTGLANQGATCYMNSLLQTLFMTPEFRRVLYAWRYTPPPPPVADAAAGAPAADAPAAASAPPSAAAAAAAAAAGEGPPAALLAESIPYQLQLLFGQLQLTAQRAITTTALTRSFGWGGADAFQQHDVQELARVLFDALERSLAGTANSQVINDLFKGSYHDYVRCEECGSERRRTDSFLDLNLAVKPFGADKALASVREALDEYQRAEVLDGANSVDCARCARKTRSAKGLKIAQPPYLLQLTLNRCVSARGARARLSNRITPVTRTSLTPRAAPAAPAASDAALSLTTRR